MIPFQISVTDLKRKLDAKEAVKLVDCREPSEYQICRIEGSELIPMNTTPARLQSIEGMAEEGTVVVYCHHGVRSLNVVNWLRQQGVENCQSLEGGIDAWSAFIDPAVPRY